MTATYDVVVIGGGAVGAACARELAVAGRSVLLIDRDAGEGDAWRAAAGMLAPQIEAHGEEPLFELGLAGRERYAALAGPLRETTGIDIGLWQDGIARVATDETDAVAVRAAVAWQRQQGHLCDWLDADEVRARWPWLARTHGALWAAREGALDPQRLVQALRADAERHGMRLVRDTVTALESAGDRITAVVGRERYAGAQVVLAAGAWSGRIDGLPRPVSVEPIRGQMAALPWPPGAARAIVYHKTGYMVARGDEAIVGSTMEYAGYRAETTSAGLARIFAGISALCPALAKAEVRRTWAGLRPGTPDGRPIIGREPRAENLWYATGHGRNGILLAAITGELIRQLMDGEPVDAPLDALEAVAPDRFWRW